MNTERIEEINDFVYEFNKQLEESYKRWEENLEKPQEQDPLDSSSTKDKKKKKANVISLNQALDIFKEPPPWKVPQGNGEFEKFKRLDYKHYPSNWEIVNSNNLSIECIYATDPT